MFFRHRMINMRYLFALVITGFVIFCGLLVAKSGLFVSADNNPTAEQTPFILLQNTTTDEKPDTAKEFSEQNTQLKAADFVTFDAEHSEETTVMLGAPDPITENADTGYKFQLELSSKGASISKATFSNGLDYSDKATGFDDRDYKDPQPLVILSPLLWADGSEILSMANKELIFVEQNLQLRLNELHWKSYEVEYSSDGSQTARFEAVITAGDTDEPVMKLTKTYQVFPASYMLNCSITVENLAETEQKVRLNLAGPIGTGREGIRTDMRRAIACYRNSKGQITTKGTRLKFSAKMLRKSNGLDKRPLAKPGSHFLWTAAVNKYFAAILVPLPDEGKNYCDWIRDKTGTFYNPDRDQRADSGDETVSVDLKLLATKLSPVGQTNNTKTYNFHLYLGPKDKRLFDKNKLYKNLGFVHTIDFLGCCCPAAIIKPLAFGILSLMEWMYGFIGNYGIVIIILVFLVRIILHPLSKKSQVSMNKFSRILSAPEVQEIRKKYAKNKTEMNKRILAFQKERGVSPTTPIMGMLPMFVQMPLWIALWSAVYASISLRGAAFLPFWITDLSAPDALVRFPEAIIVPLLKWKIEAFNLLPILMGVAFYLQQKLMPKQAAANPQAAQQQKMMMIMMPIMFPLMLYKGPSGVNLYIMSSVFAGVFEQYFIRKHIQEKEQEQATGMVAATSKTGGKVKKKKPKPFYKTH